MNILAAPVLTFFSRDFYKEAGRSSVSKGFLYLLYLSLIAVIFFILIFAVRLSPVLNEFVGWFESQMPVITVTAEGITTSAKNPYTMVHPRLGPLVTFDTSKAEASSEEMGQAAIFVAAKKVYVRDQNQGTRVYDLADLMRAKETKAMRITAETVQTFYESFKPALVAITLVFIFPFFYIWKVTAGLLYSLVGLLINLSRKSKLSYAGILNVTFFALTPSAIIQCFLLLVPGLDRIPFGMIGSLIVTSAYLFFAIKMTDAEVETPPSPAASS